MLYFENRKFLVPDQELTSKFSSQQLIDSNSQVQETFQFQNLRPSTAYEVRISHLGSQPYRYSLHLQNIDSSTLPEFAVPHRHLLDTEKLLFQTDSISHIIHSNFKQDFHPKSTQLIVTITNSGIKSSQSAVTNSESSIAYNIVCETLLSPLLPIPPIALRLALFILFCATIVTITLIVTNQFYTHSKSTTKYQHHKQ